MPRSTPVNTDADSFLLNDTDSCGRCRIYGRRNRWSALRSPFDREGLPMCLAIPMVLIERNEFQGVAEIDGVRRQISVMYVPEAEVGDYVLVHAGFAIGQVDADEAAKTLELLREYSDSMVEL